MRKLKLTGCLLVFTLFTISVFSQTTHLIDYNTFSNSNCNAFVSPPALGVTISGYKHYNSRGQSKLVNDGSSNVIELDCDYQVLGNTYIPRGTAYLIAYPFVQGYSYSIIITAAAIATTNSNYPTLWVSMDNTTYSVTSNCNGPETFTTTGNFDIINSNSYKEYRRDNFVPNFNNGQIAIQSQPSGNSSSQIYIKSVKIIETPPPCSTPPTGLFATSITANSATLNWDPIPGVISYNIYYKEASATVWNDPIISATNTTNISGLQLGTLYDWIVNARCGQAYVTNYSASQFATSGPPPGSCQAPVNLTTVPGNNSAVLNWDPVPGAASYEVLFKYEPFNSTSWQVIATGINTNSYTVSGLSPITYYGWKVRALCTSGQYSGYAEAANFITTGVCPDVSNLSSSSVTCNSAVLSWTHPSAPAYSFAFIDYKLASSSTWISLPGLFPYTNNPYTLTGLSPNSTYDWRVRSQCFGQPGNFVQSQFTTLPGTCRTVLTGGGILDKSNEIANRSTVNKEKVIDIQESTGVKIFPSPVSNLLSVELTTPVTKKTTIQLVNAAGNVVYSGQIAENKSLVEINVSKLSNGLYLLLINNGKVIRSEKVVIQH